MEHLDVRELTGRSFACLEGCGFCCTFQPEASGRELGLLRARLRPKPLAIVAGNDGRSYLGLHNKCGACTLLERRNCAQYDLRPQHCRYFPFHVHFARAPEAYVNYTCRGVARAPDGDLHDAFTTSVLANARGDDVAEHLRGARDAYVAFERNAKKHGVWGDVAAVAKEALTGDPFNRAWMETALERSDEDLTPDDLIADALKPFSHADVTKRPFYLAPDLRWLTFEGPEKLMEMDESGRLEHQRDLAVPDKWQDLDAPLRPYLEELTARGVFEGSVFAIVDDLQYETTVEEATWFRLAEIVADLAVRARILAQLGVGPEQLADETARFYDSTFLDSETIGGFL